MSLMAKRVMHPVKYLESCGWREEPMAIDVAGCSAKMGTSEISPDSHEATMFVLPDPPDTCRIISFFLRIALMWYRVSFCRGVLRVRLTDVAWSSDRMLYFK